MTPVHAIMILIIRLWAAETIIASIVSGSYYIFLDTENLGTISTEFLVTSGIWVLVGFAAWILAPWLSQRLKYNPPEAGFNIDVSAEQLVAIGSFLIGVFYLAKFGPQLFIDLGWWFVYLAGQNPAQEGQLGSLRGRRVIEWRSTLSNLLIIAVASFMAFRPAYLAKLFCWLRSAGHYDYSRDKAASPEKSP